MRLLCRLHSYNLVIPSQCLRVQPTSPLLQFALASLVKGSRNMATSSDEPMKLTKDYIKLAFGHLEETQDLNKRDIFFKEYMVENVTWEITGQDHYMAGIRHSLAEHTAASFAKLRQKIKDPIKFVIRSIVLDTTIRTACVELRGYATKLNGMSAVISFIHAFRILYFLYFSQAKPASS